MAKNLDDMPEIELDEIVKPSPQLDDSEAIELDFDSLPQPAPAPVITSDARFDEEAIDLGLDLDLSAHSEPTIDVDALASRVASSQPDPAANDVPVIPQADQEPAPVTEFPRLSSPEEATVDLDALLADIETGLEVHSPSVDEKSVSGVSQVSIGNDALPQVGDDPLDALNVELESQGEEDDVELNLDDINLDADDEPDLELDAEDVVVDSSGPVDAALEVEVEAEEVSAPMEAAATLPSLTPVSLPSTEDIPALMAADEPSLEDRAPTAEQIAATTDFSERQTAEVPSMADESLEPEPLLDMLHEATPATLETREDEISFEAEHAPIADSPLPLIVTPEDPEAPPLPLSVNEPPGQPKVPLDQLQPDPKTIETLKKIAGPSGDPESAREQLLAAFRGKPYQ
ncbi:MAG: hypothetical protein AAFU77_12715, partial [Myxococcota bacterium]